MTNEELNTALYEKMFAAQETYRARYANLWGIGSDFKGECNDSDKRFSFDIPAENSGILHLCRK